MPDFSMSNLAVAFSITLAAGLFTVLGSGLVMFSGYTDLMVDGAPSPHQSDTTLRWLIDRLRS